MKTETNLENTEAAKPDVKKTPSPVLAACVMGSVVTFWQPIKEHGFVHRATDLFDDADMADMQALLTQEGIESAKEKLKPFQYIPVAARRRYMKDFIEMLIEENGIKQVVDIGSGYDPAMRSLKRKFSNINCFEVDFAEILMPKKKMLKQKEEMLEPKGNKIKVQYISGDFRKNVLERLVAKGLNLTKDIILQMKGITQYTEPEDFQALLLEIMIKAKGRVFLVGDYTKPAMFEAAANENYESTQAVHKKFGAHIAYNNMKKFIEDQGYNVTSDITLHEIMGHYALGETPQPSLKHWGMFVATNKPFAPQASLTPSHS